MDRKLTWFGFGDYNYDLNKTKSLYVNQQDENMSANNQQ